MRMQNALLLFYLYPAFIGFFSVNVVIVPLSFPAFYNYHPFEITRFQMLLSAKLASVN